MDVLSEVLRVVELFEGALYYNAEFTAPWSFRAPPSCVVVPYFAPGGGHVIIYHLLTEGRAFAGLEHGDRVPLTAGDIVIFPHGDAHILSNGAPVEPIDNERELHRILAQGLKLARAGGGGEVTRFVCGYMSCDPQLSRVLLGGLPSVLKVSIRDNTARALAGKFNPLRCERGRCSARGRRGRAGEALRSIVRGNTPPVCCAIAAGAYGLVGWRARS